LAYSILIFGSFLIFNAAIHASQPPHVDQQAHSQAHPDNMGIMDIALLCKRHSEIKMVQDPHLDHSGANAKIRKMLFYACICYFNFDISDCLSSSELHPLHSHSSDKQVCGLLSLANFLS
jgi:hypothetical protein